MTHSYPSIIFLVLFAATTAMAQQPVAGPEPGKWTGSIAGGTDVSLGGDFHGAGTVALPDLGVLDPGFAGTSGTFSVNNGAFEDVYDPGFGVDVEAAYGLTSNDEVFGSIRYSRLEGDITQIGSAAFGGAAGDQTLFGEFADYSAITGELGYRRFFRAGRRFRPYLAGRVGVVFVDEIDATFTVPDADFSLRDVQFYDSTATFSVGAGPGFSYQITDSFGLGLENTVRYTGELDGDDTQADALGFGALNDNGARISVATQLRARLRF